MTLYDVIQILLNNCVHLSVRWEIRIKYSCRLSVIAVFEFVVADKYNHVAQIGSMPIPAN